MDEPTTDERNKLRFIIRQSNGLTSESRVDETVAQVFRMGFRLVNMGDVTITLTRAMAEEWLRDFDIKSKNFNLMAHEQLFYSQLKEKLNGA